MKSNKQIKTGVIAVFLIYFNLITAGISQVIQVEDMPIKTAGVPIPGGWLLDTEGYVADTVDFASEGFYSFTVRAKGEKENKQWPFMEVKLGSLMSGPVLVDQGSWHEYQVVSKLSFGRHQLALEYINDEGKRGLFLDRVRISPIEIDEQSWTLRFAENVLTCFPEPWSYSITNWQIEELMWGVAKAYEITGDIRYLNYIRSHLDSHVSSGGYLDIEINDITPGILLIWLYEATGDEKYLNAALQVAEYLLNEYPRTSEGGFVNDPSYDDQLYIGMLAGLGRFLGLLGYVTGDRRFFDEGALQIIVHANHLQDGATGLFYHAWDEDGSAEWAVLPNHCSPIFWARGNGWAIRGIVDFLEFLPDDHPDREQIIEIYRRQVSGLINYQDDVSGLWFTVIDSSSNGQNYLEASGSLLFAYGIQKGINLEILDDQYQEKVNRANEGLYLKIYEKDDDEIFVTGISGGTEPGDFENYVTKAVSTSEQYFYVSGLLLQEKVEIQLNQQSGLIISNVNVFDITDTSAVISWVTNWASDSQVEYGLSDEYEFSSGKDVRLVKLHNVKLTGLSENTTYHYRVISHDSDDQVAVSEDNTFTTLKSPNLSFSDISIPSGIGGPDGVTYIGGHGTAFADVDQDNLSDLYLSMLFNGAISDVFFHNKGDNIFQEEATLRGIDDFDGGTHGVCFADLDNDGDFDLINGTTFTITGEPAHNNIYRNDGNGYFEDMTSGTSMEANRYPTRGVVAFDMENDGDLDIFCVSNYLGSGDPPDELNEVYRNEGNWTFTSIDTGVLVTCPAGQGATTADYDNDGDVDVFAGNRTGPLNILQNDGTGHFQLIPPQSIGIFHQGREGVTFGDIDDDKDLDVLLVGDSTGYLAYLYQNNGDGTFTYIRNFEEIDGYMGGFADLDNDGDLDLIFSGDQLCYLNDGNGNFEEGPVIPVSGINDPRSISFSDIDNDGDVDFVIGSKRSRSYLIRNNLKTGNWLKIKLISANGQAGAFGAKVYVYPVGQIDGKIWEMREARSCNGYLGQNDPVLHFGLGEFEFVDIVVVFPCGQEVIKTQIPANQTIVITSNPPPVDQFFKDETANAHLDLDSSGKYGISVADIDGDLDPDVYINNRNDIDIPEGDYRGNYLFRNDGNGQFSRIEETAGVKDQASSAFSSIFLDMDHDGDFDLAVGHGNDGINRRGLFRNNGIGIFEQVDPLSGFQETGDLGTRSIIAGDMNGDLFIDILFGSKNGFDTEYYIGNGFGNFTRKNNLNDRERDILGMSMADLDQDGDLDVLLGNSTTDDGVGFFRNDGGGNFIKRVDSGLPESGKVTSANLCDIDRDGDLDILINGNRQGVSDLYRNSNNNFVLIQSFPIASGNEEERNETNGVFADFDNDGDFDLFLPSGNPKFWVNNGEGGYTAIDDTTSGFTYEAQGISFPAVFDYDLDGDVDILLSQSEGPVKLFGNYFANGQYLKVRIIGPMGDAGGFGSKAWVYKADHLNEPEFLIGFQEVIASAGFGAQNEPILHFGTGIYQHVDVRIRFMDGTEKLFTNVSTNQLFTVLPDEFVTVPLQPTGPDSILLGEQSFFVTGGSRSSFHHQVEYQFEWGDSTWSTWGDSIESHIYHTSDIFNIRARARCKSHPEVLSDWSMPHQILVRGLNLKVKMQPDSAGRIEVDPCKSFYAFNDTVRLTPKSDDGYIFDHWSGDLNGNKIPGLVVMEADKEITAHFEKIQESISRPDSMSGPSLGYRGENLIFVAYGGRSNVNHPLEYQFDWGDGQLSSWGDSINSKTYFESGIYDVRVRGRCKIHHSYVSDWTDNFQVTVSGCVLTVEIDPEQAGEVIKNPDKQDYDFGEQICLTPNNHDGYKFSCWNHNKVDSSLSKLITLYHDTTLIACFEMITGLNDGDMYLPDNFALDQNFPNPFNSNTIIQYQIPAPCEVEIKIFNIEGQLIRTLEKAFKQPGYYSIKWNATDNQGLLIPTGVYFYILRTTNFKKMKKLILLR